MKGDQTNSNSPRSILINAAMDLSSHRSFQDIQLEDLLNKTGLQKPEFYECFSDLHTLYLEIIRVAAAEIQDTTVLDPDLPFEKALDQVVRNFVSYAATRPFLFRSLIGSSIDPCTQPEVYTIVTQVKEVITERVAERMGISEEIPFAHLLIRGSIGFVESAVLTWIDRKYMHKQQLVEVINGALHTSLIPLAKQLPTVK